MISVRQIQLLDLKGIVCPILMILFVSMSNNAFANQNVLEKMISLEVKNFRFKKVLSMIEDQANVHFVYNPEAVDVNKVVSITVKNTKLDLVLKELLVPISVNYLARDNRILLKAELPKPVPKINYDRQSLEK